VKLVKIGSLLKTREAIPTLPTGVRGL